MGSLAIYTFFLCLVLCNTDRLKLEISENVSIQFFQPLLITDAADPQFFMQIEPAFVAGSLSGATFVDSGTQNSGQWNESYVDNATDPGIGYAFPINSNTISNLGSFPAIPTGQTVTAINSTNPILWYKDPSSNQLLFNKTMGTMMFTGIPYGIGNSKFANGLRLGGAQNIILNDGSFLQTAIVFWGGNTKYKTATSIISFRSIDLIHWNFLSIIANASQYMDSDEGPNEHDLSYLADGKTIMCLIRLDAGDGPTTHSFKYYAKSLSVDEGKTWSPLQTINKMGCARPRLRLFKMNENNSVLTASGGRMRNDGTSDILFWIDPNGNDLNWTMISISYIHNKLAVNVPLYDKNVNSTTYSPRETNSYTSLMDWGQNQNDNTANGIITYDMNKSGKQYSFSMNFMLQLT